MIFYLKNLIILKIQLIMMKIMEKRKSNMKMMKSQAMKTILKKIRK